MKWKRTCTILGTVLVSVVSILSAHSTSDWSVRIRGVADIEGVAGAGGVGLELGGGVAALSGAVLAGAGCGVGVSAAGGVVAVAWACGVSFLAATGAGLDG